MTDEERQRTMNFILEQMAQLAASAQRHEEEKQKREKADTRRDVSIAQIRRLLAWTIWERRRDRRDWNERMAALANAQLRADERHSQLDEKMNALIDAQMRSEEAQSRLSAAQAKSGEAQSRSDAWQARMEENFARSTERLAYLEDLTARNSVAIEKLTDAVADMARRRNGGDGAA
jgi:hypothetical protein